jgi:hypothetical protein
MTTDTELTRWNQLVYDLNGTCEDLHNHLTNHDAEDLIDNDDFLQFLDNEIFCCASCGWWHPISEMSEQEEPEPICVNCEDE